MAGLMVDVDAFKIDGGDCSPLRRARSGAAQLPAIVVAQSLDCDGGDGAGGGYATDGGKEEATRLAGGNGILFNIGGQLFVTTPTMGTIMAHRRSRLGNGHERAR